MTKVIEILEHDDIDDAVEHLLRNSEIVGDSVNSYMEAHDYVTENDVDRLLNDGQYMDESGVQRMLDDAGYVDEADLDRLVDDKLDTRGILDENDVDRQIEDWVAANLDEHIDTRVAELDSDNEDIAELRRQLGDLAREVQTLTLQTRQVNTFFDLLRKAAEFLVSR